MVILQMIYLLVLTALVKLIAPTNLIRLHFAVDGIVTLRIGWYRRVLKDNMWHGWGSPFTPLMTRDWYLLPSKEDQ